MSIAALHVEPRHLWKVEDLDAPEFADRLSEIWAGELIEMTRPSNLHGLIAANVLFQFMSFCHSRRGIAFAGDNNRFVPARNPDTLLSPDAGLFRVRNDWLEQLHHTHVPEFAVEITSPSNLRGDRMAKRLLYFKYGAEQVWEIDPAAKTLEIFFRDGRSIIATGAIVPGEGIAAGLAFDLDSIFLPPPA